MFLTMKIHECSNFFSDVLQVTNESLRSLSTLEKLEEITMVCCLFIDDDGLQMLSAGNSLKVIPCTYADLVWIHFVYYDVNFLWYLCAYCIFNLICSRVLMYQGVPM